MDERQKIDGAQQRSLPFDFSLNMTRQIEFNLTKQDWSVGCSRPGLPRKVGPPP
jgi:hypothetical protein